MEETLVLHGHDSYYVLVGGEMSKKTKAAKHAMRVRSQKKKKPRLPNRINPLLFAPKAIQEIAFDQALLHVLKASGIRDALFNIIKNAPPKDEEEEGPKTIQ